MPMAAKATLVTGPIAIPFDADAFAADWLPLVTLAVGILRKDKATLRKLIAGEFAAHLVDAGGIHGLIDDLGELDARLRSLAEFVRVAQARCQFALCQLDGDKG
jgi:hypothetical protein